MDVEIKPKGLRLKRWQKKQLWFWRLGQKSESSKKAYAKYYQALRKSRLSQGTKSEKKKLHRLMMNALSELQQTQASYLKHCRRMQRLVKRGQLVNGEFFCKAGKAITKPRMDQYEALCHFMVRKFLPGLGLWEASLSYDDLINQCRLEIFLALLNGFNPKSVMKDFEDIDASIKKLEQTIVYGRLKSFLRRLTWKHHPDQLGGHTWSLDQIADPRLNPNAVDGYASQEFKYGIFSEPKLFPVDFVKDQQDRLMDILDSEGPEAVKKAFFALDSDAQDVLKEKLFHCNEWSELADLGGEES